MPIYEFQCRLCGQISSIYQQGFAAISHPCPNCGNDNLERIFSSFAVRKTDRQVYEEIRSDRQFERALKQNDPKAIAQWVERTGRGDKVPDECEETIGRLAKGEWPKKKSQSSGSE